MTAPRTLLLLILASLALALALLPIGTRASSIQYRYKFPCYIGGSCWVTNPAHGSPSAIDFDPLGSGGLGPIPAMAQGTVLITDSSQSTCTYYQGIHGLGVQVRLSDIDNAVPARNPHDEVGHREAPPLDHPAADFAADR